MINLTILELSNSNSTKYILFVEQSNNKKSKKMKGGKKYHLIKNTYKKVTVYMTTA